MKQVLRKLFTPEQPPTVMATVQRWIAPGCYEVIDDGGRVLPVNSDVTLKPQSRVRVQNGQATAVSGVGQVIRTYEV